MTTRAHTRIRVSPVRACVRATARRTNVRKQAAIMMMESGGAPDPARSSENVKAALGEAPPVPPQVKEKLTFNSVFPLAY